MEIKCYWLQAAVKLTDENKPDMLPNQKNSKQILMKYLILILPLFLVAFEQAPIDANKLIEKNGIYYEADNLDTFTGTLVHYYEGGRVKERAGYQNGTREGLRETFHENGQLFEKENYKDGELSGLFQGFYDNGQLWWQGQAKNNLRNGALQAFYANGQLKYQGQHRDNSQEGVWQYFDEDGNLSETRCYLDNVQVELSSCSTPE